jgi:hypothetical protein
MLNSMISSFLNVLEAKIPLKYGSMKENIDWITQEIKISCTHKNSLHTFTEKSDVRITAHYITYCKILRKVVKEFKKQHYSKL